MSNYYISKCCGEQVEWNDILHEYRCLKCKRRCEVTAMLDTPCGVPKGEILKSLKEDAMLEEAVASVELANGVPKARELAELFLGDNQNKPEAKEAVIQAGTRIIESLLAEQKAELLSKISTIKRWVMTIRDNNASTAEDEFVIREKDLLKILK